VYRLSKGRKKRPVPEGWATAEDVSALETIASTTLPVPQPTSLALEGGYAAIAGPEGNAAIYSVEADKLERHVPVGAPVTDTVWAGGKLIFSTTQGTVKVFERGDEVAAVSENSGAVTALSVHPLGDLVAFVGLDKSIVLFDLTTLKRVSRTYNDSCECALLPWTTFNLLTLPALTCCAFHPDGHILAVGTSTGALKLYMTATLEPAVTFSLGAPIQALAFSENGYWVAATAKGQSSVTVFDLRKEGDAAVAKVLETGGAVSGLSWDYTGQFLATAGGSGVTVQQFTKSSKSWSEPFRSSVGAVAVRWGEEAKQLVSVNAEGVVSVFGAKQEA
jgi:pre-mRNA-processing factor 19